MIPLTVPVGGLLIVALIVQTIRLERMREQLRSRSNAWVIDAILSTAREVRRG